LKTIAGSPEFWDKGNMQLRLTWTVIRRNPVGVEFVSVGVPWVVTHGYSH